jgi:hypothetical protein
MQVPVSKKADSRPVHYGKTINQCCGAGPFLCGNGPSLSKISSSTYILENFLNFSWFLKNFMLFQVKMIIKDEKGSLK